jgi:hypothetical protein
MLVPQMLGTLGLETPVPQMLGPQMLGPQMLGQRMLGQRMLGH